MFAEKGFRAATIEEIASAAGLTRGAFHWHFASKEDLLLAALEHQRAAENDASNERTAASGGDLHSAVSDELGSWDAEYVRQKQLLSFEALLYAARHPHVRERLAAMKRSGMNVIAARAETIADELILSVEDVTAMFQAINDGLAMQDLFFGENRFRERYERLFPVLLAAATGRPDLSDDADT